MRRLIPVAVLALLALAVTLPATAANKPKKLKTVDVTLLAVNDFHGNLEPRRPGRACIRTGRASRRAAPRTWPPIWTRSARRRKTDRTVTVAAGDLIGASPLLSAAFHDEPTIEALNMMGLDVSRRRQPRVRRGLARAAPDADRRLPAGRRRVTPGHGCPDASTRSRAPTSSTSPRTCSSTEHAAAAVRRRTTIKSFETAARSPSSAMTLEGTPQIVTQSGVAGLTFKRRGRDRQRAGPDPAEEGREVDRRAAARGRLPERPTRRRTTAAPGSTGPIVDIVTGWTRRSTRSSPATPTRRTTALRSASGALVTSASSFGRLVTDVAAEHRPRPVTSSG